MLHCPEHMYETYLLTSFVINPHPDFFFDSVIDLLMYVYRAYHILILTYTDVFVWDRIGRLLGPARSQEDKWWA